MRRAAAIATVAALVTAAAGCFGGSGDRGSGPETLTVYVSVPLHGSRAAEGTAIADGARLALAEGAGRVGPLRVRGVYLDDTEGGEWTMAQAGANARRASEDSSSIGYIGDVDSGATKASLPITNQAQLAQISPASTAVDLTRLPAAGGGNPDRYQPDDRTFARVVPDDDVQARAAAVWAKRLGAKTFAATSDHSDFGDVTEDAFAKQARSLGMRPFTPKEPKDGVFPPKVQGPDAVYLAISSPPPPVPPGVAPGAVAATLPNPTFAPEALLGPAFLRSPLNSIEGRLHVISPFLDPSELPAKGEAFVRAYRQRFGAAPKPAAAYGYEAMALLLDAIHRAGGDGDSRGAVVDQVLATRDRDSVLGSYSIDGNGDTTLDSVSGYRVRNGRPVSPVKLTAPR